MGARSETGTGTTIPSTVRRAYLYVGVGDGFSLGLLPICTRSAAAWRCAGRLGRTHQRAYAEGRSAEVLCRCLREINAVGSARCCTRIRSGLAELTR
jgi:hypothetical protein